MGPEWFDETRGVSFCNDIYALGITIFEVITNTQFCRMRKIKEIKNSRIEVLKFIFNYINEY